MANEKSTLTEQFMRMGRLLMKECLRHIDDGPQPDLWRKRLLGLVGANPGLTAAELTELLSRRMPAGEELLLGLESKGYIELTAKDGSDEKTVTLTELGRGEAAAVPDFGEAFDVLSEDEQATMRAYLSRVIDGLEKKAARDGGDGCRLADDWFPGYPNMGSPAGLARLRKMHAMFRSGRGPGRRCPDDGFGPGGTFGEYLWDMRGGM